MRRSIVVFAVALMALAATAQANVTRIPHKCGSANAPRLCAIHFHRTRTNQYRQKMGLRGFQYGWVAEAHPAKRGRILTLWVHRQSHWTKRYHSWVKLQNQSPVGLGRKMAAARGWTGSQWSALYALWNRESGWNPNAYNSTSGACGIPQALPCSKIPDHSVRGQIAWGMDYIHGCYGTPAKAEAHSEAYGWY